MTYDRAVTKMNVEKVRTANTKLYLPPPIVKTVLPTATTESQTWRYTTKNPGYGWQHYRYNDSKWKTGPSGFGTQKTPGAIIGTEWKSSNIWLRREFDLGQKDFTNLHLIVHHDEDAVIHINSVLAADLKGYTTDYIMVPLSGHAIKALKKNRNVIAIHCKQTSGGQFIDAGLVDITEHP